MIYSLHEKSSKKMRLYMLLISLAIIFYLVMAYCFLNEWLDFFLADKDMTAEQRSISYVVLGLATTFWPVIVPIAYLELLKFNKKHRDIIAFIRNETHPNISDIYDK
jgi:hypothetical protein